MVISENQLYADLFVNLKGSKNKTEDWMTIAKKCEKVIKDLGSIKLASEKLGVSYELLRSINSLNNLPVEVQELVRQNEIKFDAAKRINTIKQKHWQIEVANSIKNLPSHKQRNIINQAKLFPNSDLTDFKKRVLTPLTKKVKLHVVIIPLTEKIYKKIEKQSIKKNQSIEKILSDIIESRFNEKEE